MTLAGKTFGVYAGGTIRIGQVVARRKDDCTVEMLYQCVSVSHELGARVRLKLASPCAA